MVGVGIAVLGAGSIYEMTGRVWLSVSASVFLPSRYLPSPCIAGSGVQGGIHPRYHLHQYWVDWRHFFIMIQWLNGLVLTTHGEAAGHV